MPNRVIPLDTILPPQKISNLHRAVRAVAEAQAALDAAKLEAQELCLDAYEATELKGTLSDFNRVAVVFNDVASSFTAKETYPHARDIGKYLHRNLPAAFDGGVVAAVIDAATAVMVDLQRFTAKLKRTPGARRPTITVVSTACNLAAKQALDAVLDSVDQLTLLLTDLTEM